MPPPDLRTLVLLSISIAVAVVLVAVEGFVARPSHATWTSSSAASAFDDRDGERVLVGTAAPAATTTPAAEAAKEAFLLLATEAYETYYSQQQPQEEDGAWMSQEKYLTLALSAWNDGVAKGNSEDGDGGGGVDARSFSSAETFPGGDDVTSAVGQAGAKTGASSSAAPANEEDANRAPSASSSARTNDQDETTEVVAGNGNPLWDLLAKWSPLFAPKTAGTPAAPPSASFNPLAMFFDREKTEAESEMQWEDENVPYGLRTSVSGPSSPSDAATPDANGGDRASPSGAPVPAGERVTRGVGARAPTERKDGAATAEKRPVEPVPKRSSSRVGARTPVETKEGVATTEKRPVEPVRKRRSSSTVPTPQTSSKGAGRRPAAARAPAPPPPSAVAEGRGGTSAPAGDGAEAARAAAPVPLAATGPRPPPSRTATGAAAERAAGPPQKTGAEPAGRGQAGGEITSPAPRNDTKGTTLVSPGVGKKTSVTKASFSTSSTVGGDASFDPLKGAATMEGPREGFAAARSNAGISPRPPPKNTGGTGARPEPGKGAPFTKTSASVGPGSGKTAPFAPKSFSTISSGMGGASSYDPSKGASAIEGPQKGFAAAGSNAGISPQPPPTNTRGTGVQARGEILSPRPPSDLKGTALASPGAGKNIPFAQTSFSTTSLGTGGASSLDPSKGASTMEGPQKGFAAAVSNAGISPQPPPENTRGMGMKAQGEILSPRPPSDLKGTTLPSPGVGKNTSFMQKSFSTTSSGMGGASSLDPLKGASTIEGPQKGFAVASSNVGISPQPPLKNTRAMGVSPGLGKSVPFMKKSASKLPVMGVPPSFDPSKGTAQVQGRQEGQAVESTNAQNDMPLVPPPFNMIDKKSMRFPNPLKGSAGSTTTGNNNQMGVSADSFKGAQMEKIANESTFPKGLKQPNDILPKTKGVVGTVKSPAFPSAPQIPVKDPPPNDKATYQTSGSNKEKALQTSSGVSTQMIAGFSVPPSPAGTTFLGSQASALLTDDSERSSMAEDRDALQVFSTALTAADEPWLASLGDIMDKKTAFPLLHVGNRIGSSVHGTTHEGFLVLPTEDINSIDMCLNENNYQVKSCVAKRPWSILELNATVASKIAAFEQQQYEAVKNNEFATPESWELDAQAASVRRYYEVEIHIFQKFEKKKALYKQLRRQKQQKEQGSGSRTSFKDGNDSAVDNVANIAVPIFLRVYPDDGSGAPRADDAIPDYGLTGLDVWGKALGAGHEWLVFEGRLDAAPTLLQAIEIQNTQNGNRHRLHGLKQAMNLPDSELGDALDAIFRSLLENLVFLSSSNVVHRDLKLRNILCDGDNQRVRLTNFGNAVDLDPPRVGLDNDSIEWEGPGSIANTLAADTFSAALIMCQLIFGVSDVVLNQQLKDKDVGYDLDKWLNVVADSDSIEVGEALNYLRERPGLYSLLKGAIRPNPLRKKIATQNMSIYNEVMGAKSGAIVWGDERTKTIAREESVINPLSKSGEPPNEEIETSKPISSNGMKFDYKAFDITRAPYMMQPPTKSSISALTKLSASTVKKRASVEMRNSRKENYYDITRAPFQRISPQPTQRDSLTILDDEADSKCIGVEVVHIIAPAGKLGVEVDTPPAGGPSYVSSISGNSPLLGQILLGDRIIAVDDDDVQQFVADDISMILISKSNNAVRKISLLREVGGEKQPPSSDIKTEQYARTVQKVLTKEHDLADEKRRKEVEQWLLSYLPYITNADAANYCKCFIEDGFDCLVMLDEVIEEDFYFMKTAHRRVVTRKLFGLTRAKNTQALPAGSDQLAVKKIYKVDEALGVAARLGIERKLAEGKRLAAKKAEMEQKVNNEKE